MQLSFRLPPSGSSHCEHRPPLSPGRWVLPGQGQDLGLTPAGPTLKNGTLVSQYAPRVCVQPPFSSPSADRLAKGSSRAGPLLPACAHPLPAWPVPCGLLPLPLLPSLLCVFVRKILGALCFSERFCQLRCLRAEQQHLYFPPSQNTHYHPVVCSLHPVPPQPRHELQAAPVPQHPACRSKPPSHSLGTAPSPAPALGAPPAAHTGGPSLLSSMRP